MPSKLNPKASLKFGPKKIRIVPMMCGLDRMWGKKTDVVSVGRQNNSNVFMHKHIWRESSNIPRPHTLIKLRTQRAEQRRRFNRGTVGTSFRGQTRHSCLILSFRGTVFCRGGWQCLQVISEIVDCREEPAFPHFSSTRQPSWRLHTSL